MSTSAAPRTAAFATLALFAFAANSVLCRLALSGADISPGAFTLIRLVSGAMVLMLLVAIKHMERKPWQGGSLLSALALVAYAVAFSFAYVALDTAAGALILFAAVQITMIGGGIIMGHSMTVRQWVGAAIAMGGLVYFLNPDVAVTAPDPGGAALMAISGAAWGIYSLRGRGSPNALRATTGNFAIASLISVPALFVLSDWGSPSGFGITLGVLSGALTSGVGYAIWYAALAHLKPQVAAISQLSVPLIAAAGGVVFLGETLAAHFVVSALIVLSGMFLVIYTVRR